MNQTLWMIFRGPLLLACLSLVGLVSGLLGDGPWDGLSWLSLGIPTLWVSAWCLKPLIGRRPRAR
ncbi:hypothetical protein AAFF27_00485 [Xylophilus sp. GW821-FHT01B05]